MPTHLIRTNYNANIMPIFIYLFIQQLKCTYTVCYYNKVKIVDTLLRNRTAVKIEGAGSASTYVR